jgi:phosphate-selective porin OprO and OprP
MKKTKQIIYILFLVVACSVNSQLYAQDQNVTGTIISTADGKPISDVKVRVKGEKEIGAVTDANGNYSIKVGANTSGELVFVHPSFDFMELNVNGRSVVNVALESNVRYNAYGQQVNRVPLIAESRNGILVIESADQMYKTWFDLRVNFDGAKYFDKKTYNELGDGFTIRRLRFAMKTVLYKHWTGEVDLNFAGGALDVKDAFMGYRSDPQKYYIKAGYFKEPISMETTTTSRYQTFIEEPFMTEFAPARQLGFNFSKWDSRYLAVAGIHFNDVENLEVTTYSQDINKANGTDEGYSVTGKFVFRPMIEDNKVIHVGVSGSYRTPKTSWEVPNTFRISMRDMTNISRKKFLDTGDEITFVKNYTLLGTELSAAYNNIKFSSEYIKTNIKRKAGNESYQASGLYAAVAYMVFGGKYNYNEEEGEFSQVTRGRKWGDIEVALRYDYVNLNDKQADIWGGSATGYTAGVTYHANPNVKFMINYSYINHDRYANGKSNPGTLYVGHDVTGALTKDYTKVVDSNGKSGEDYGFMQFRCEIDF